MRAILLIAVFIFSCNTPKPEPGTINTGVANESELNIICKVVKIEKLNETRFKVVTVLEQDYATADFNVGDTLKLYPNFIRREGAGINLEDAQNKKMNALLLLNKGEKINAKIKMRGKGKKQHGLIMGWELEK
jgi:hypothetical protein